MSFVSGLCPSSLGIHELHLAPCCFVLDCLRGIFASRVFPGCVGNFSIPFFLMSNINVGGDGHSSLSPVCDVNIHLIFLWLFTDAYGVSQTDGVESWNYKNPSLDRTDRDCKNNSTYLLYLQYSLCNLCNLVSKNEEQRWFLLLVKKAKLIA